MESRPHDLPVRLAGRKLRSERHICAFFHSQEEENEVLLPFIKEGYDRGEKLFHIVDKRQREDHLSCCASAGIDVARAEQSRQLEVRTWEEAYLEDGHFDGDRMVRSLEKVLQGAKEEFGMTRLVGKMEWALEDLPGVNDIVRYETLLNFILPRYSDPVVCVYDLNKHSGSVVMDILRTHPMVIVGGVLQENPLYVPPDELLAELDQRDRVSRASSSATRRRPLDAEVA